MYNIVLICQYGASTGILADKIKEAASDQGIECVVNAYSFSQIGEVIDAADIVLLGPQIRLKKAAYEKEYAGKGVPFEVIDTMDYGMLNGKNVFNKALSIIKATE